MNVNNLYTIFWIISGVMAAGVLFKWSQLQHPSTARDRYYGDMTAAIIFTLGGPLSFVVVPFLCLAGGYRSRTHGWGFHSPFSSLKIQSEAMQKTPRSK